jgi:hypothetical protein
MGMYLVELSNFSLEFGNLFKFSLQLVPYSPQVIPE